MRTREENFMSMARAVEDTLRRHETVWGSLPRFAVYGAQLFDLTRQMDGRQVHAGMLSTGATIDKDRAGEDALHLAGNLSRRAIAYAEDTRQYELRNQLKIKRYELLHGHDAGILHKLRDLQQQLEGLLLQLADYGIVQQQLTEFKDRIDVYERLLTHPRDVIVERKTQNQFVGDYMKVLRRLLQNMDRLVNVFEGTEFEYEYHNARIVVTTGTRHRPPSGGTAATGTSS